MLGTSRGDEIIVASKIEMIHALGLVVVAEGVETQAHDPQPRNLGCDLVQGFYHARPARPHEPETLPICVPLSAAGRGRVARIVGERAAGGVW
jgi:EAL domain-containing protein (putative c-di-GMP-specific phosphodiesterase class I)